MWNPIGKVLANSNPYADDLKDAVNQRLFQKWVNLFSTRI